MSKPYDYQKELKDSLIDATLLTSGLYAAAFAASKAGISKPTLAFSAENILKFALLLTACDMVKDWAKVQPWFPKI